MTRVLLSSVLLAVFSLALGGCVPPSSPGPGGNTQTGNQEEPDHHDRDNDREFQDWAWVEVEDTKCGRGTPAGLGLKQGSDTSRLMIFFAGGGACWDGVSCHIVNSAVNIERNYGEEHFRQELRPLLAHDLLDQQDGPFGDIPMAYFPYCTGDFHVGDAVGSYDAFNPNRLVHHHGARNTENYLALLAEGYPEVEEVFVVGVSAGGFGALMNFHRLQAAFPGIPIHILSDGSPLIQPRDGRWGAFKRAWNFELPPGCEDCDTQFSAFATHAINGSQEGRIALLTYEEDQVVGLYFAYQSGLRTATMNLVNDVYGPERVFLKSGTDHVMLQYYPGLESNEGQRLEDFVWAWSQGE